MKCYIFLIALVLAAPKVKSHDDDEMDKIATDCATELNVKPEDIDAVFKDDMKTEPTEELKCHMKCVMEKLGQWKDGAFDAENAIARTQSIPELKDKQDEIAKIVNDCKDKTGANECDTSYLITKCIYDQHILEHQ